MFPADRIKAIPKLFPRPSWLMVLIFTIVSVDLFAHEGHDQGREHVCTVKDVQLQGKDGVVYLDAGKSLTIGAITLIQKVNDQNQIVYVSNTAPSSGEKNQKAEVACEIPGGEKLKAFKSASLAQYAEEIEIATPGFSSLVELGKSKDNPIEWVPPAREGTQVKIIVEFLEKGKAERTVIGRLVINAKDDGLFVIKPAHLEKFILGEAEIAVKRLQFSSYKKKDSDSGMIAIKSVDAKIAKARLVQ